MKKQLTTSHWVNILKSGRKFYKMADLMKVSGLGYTACRAAASRLVKGKLLLRVGKELYGNLLTEFAIEEAACRAYAPSYISFEYALCHHGVIDQMSVVLTMATLRKSREVSIGRTTVVYQHLRKNLFWGYEAEGDSFIACPEKALLDLLYLDRKRRGKGRSLDEINWDMLDKAKFETYALKFPKGMRTFQGCL